jgi:hypothetical protein
MAPGQNEIASTIHRSALSLNTGGISPAQRGIALSFATRDDPDRVVARRPLKPQRLGASAASASSALRASVTMLGAPFARCQNRRVCDVRVELFAGCYRGEE